MGEEKHPGYRFVSPETQPAVDCHSAIKTFFPGSFSFSVTLLMISQFQYLGNVGCMAHSSFPAVNSVGSI